jgi:hypothetical protein
LPRRAPKRARLLNRKISATSIRADH